MIAFTISNPIPGIVKMLSIMTDPPIMLGNTEEKTVIKNKFRSFYGIKPLNFEF